MDYQKILLLGNATDVAKVQTPQDKTAYADFSVAVNRNQNETDFFAVRVFGNLTEVAAKIKKGGKVFVDGRLEISRYKTEQGEQRMALRVLANTLRLL